MDANGPLEPTDWQSVNWRKANRQVRNLRRRIFRASRNQDWRTVHRLQVLMLRSYANRLVAVRRVTQVNTGKHTPGVDHEVVLTPRQRGALTDDLRRYQPWRAQPVKRVCIPKANGTSRPLGIPTIRDRALQAMVKNALEPSWEARFEGSSDGFRPGRGCHDAIMRVYALSRCHLRKKWVVDADIAQAFDTISHAFLLQIIGPVPGHALIKQWLRAGYLDETGHHETSAGTPQGGVISPLLANIALHGLEAALGVRYNGRGHIISSRAVVRYADDFVVFCETREDAEAVLQLLPAWLAERGLTLSQQKTQIVHLTEGFDFLGFTIRQYPAPTTRKSGYTLLITPSRAAVQTIRATLREAWRAGRGHPAEAVIRRLNPIIRGWANYFRVGNASHTFQALDHWMFYRERRYVRFTHPTKSAHWNRQRYWGQFHATRKDRWVFGDPHTGRYLLKFSWFPVERHVMVRGTASPDDPQLTKYWTQRRRVDARRLPDAKRRIAARQGYTCPRCGDGLVNEEDLHLHHVHPRSAGGSDQSSNLVLLHRYCHHQVHGHRSVLESTDP
jgi:RNA-directed DNA polymerase